VFRNGVLTPTCNGAAGTAAPDPCVHTRTVLPNGNLIIGVYTSQASVWTLGTEGPQVVANPTMRGEVKAHKASTKFAVEVTNVGTMSTTISSTDIAFFAYLNGEMIDAAQFAPTALVTRGIAAGATKTVRIPLGSRQAHAQSRGRDLHRGVCAVLGVVELRSPEPAHWGHRSGPFSPGRLVLLP
jgi:hypothetical protein